MSFWEDDFYSTKPLADTGFGRRRWRQHRNGGPINPAGIVAGSLTAGILLAILVMSLLTGDTKETGTVQEARAAMVMNAQISFNDMVILAAEKVNPAVVGVVIGRKLADMNGAGADAAEDSANSQDSRDENLESSYSVGSGVIFQKIKKKAYIVTNHHVVEGSSEAEIILSTGERKKARVVGSDNLTDLAVLEVEASGIEVVAELGDSDLLRAGEAAIAIGNPLGLVFSQTITMGVISSTHRIVPVSLESYMDWEMDFIQTDAAINQGNSGGALVNIEGQVVGINSMKVSYMGVEGLGFAIPINAAKPVLESLIASGKVKRPFLGIVHQDLQSFAAGTEVLNLPKGVKQGIIVLEATGPAEAAGLQTNDVIIAMDGVAIDGSLSMRKYLYTKKKIGDEIKITLIRDGKKATLVLLLAEKE